MEERVKKTTEMIEWIKPCDHMITKCQSAARQAQHGGLNTGGQLSYFPRNMNHTLDFEPTKISQIKMLKS